MYDDVDSVVHVYAPEGNDLKLHLARINAYNSRTESPTNWKEEVYTGNDFFEKMIVEKKGKCSRTVRQQWKEDRIYFKYLEEWIQCICR